jgi:hypothetical protein
LKRVVLDPADGRFVRLQVVCAASHSCTQENKFRHNYFGTAIIPACRHKSNVNTYNDGFTVGRPMGFIMQTVPVGCNNLFFLEQTAELGK